MARGRRLRKSAGGELEMNKENGTALDDAILLPNVIVSDKAILLLDVGVSDEAILLPDVMSNEAILLPNVVVSNEEDAEPHVAITAEQDMAATDEESNDQNSVATDQPIKKSKPGRPSTSAGGPRHQDHAKMNARILGNAMVVQRRNDQKVASRARAKAEREWNHLVALAKQCPPFPKPPLGQTEEEFVATAVQVEMQRCHFYTARHVAKAANATAAYQAKHGIVDTDMG
ncbi:unnamed protein product [Sphagnum jensenii]|uniref:Uncharacterized protein n=1 Tax=Sphagnum jensenii TaxID=128206 RepID=A0ABP0XMQ7_9BRYO